MKKYLQIWKCVNKDNNNFCIQEKFYTKADCPVCPRCRSRKVKFVTQTNEVK